MCYNKEVNSYHDTFLAFKLNKNEMRTRYKFVLSKYTILYRQCHIFKTQSYLNPIKIKDKISVEKIMNRFSIVIVPQFKIDDLGKATRFFIVPYS